MKGIKHLARNDIDPVKWDKCLRESSNGLIYGQSAYLDHMSENWEALVYGDYEALMPLCYTVRVGFRLLYQPNFSQQHGVFGNQVPAEIFREMANMARHLFSYADINLNYENTYLSGIKKNNFIIPLAEGYDRIFSSYSGDLRKNLKRAGKLDLEYLEEGEAGEILAIYRNAYGKRFPHVRKSHFDAMQAYCSTHPGEVVIRKVKHAGELIAAALLLNDERRLYFLFSYTPEKGRNMEANHFLVDRLLHEFSGRSLCFDFEGSDIPGIAAFYKQFGAVNQPYSSLKWNDLPWPVRLLKR